MTVGLHSHAYVQDVKAQIRKRKCRHIAISQTNRFVCSKTHMAKETTNRLKKCLQNGGYIYNVFI